MYMHMTEIRGYELDDRYMLIDKLEVIGIEAIAHSSIYRRYS